MMTLSHTPYLLMILDGWGYSEDPKGNAILAAKTPHWDALWQRYPHALISGSGLDVGLPAGQMGNSEVGHLNMGAGRRVPQELVRINLAIADDSFNENVALEQAVDQAASSAKVAAAPAEYTRWGINKGENCDSPPYSSPTSRRASRYITMKQFPLSSAGTAGKVVHILGLLSPGGVHSHEDHVIAMVKLAVQRGAKKVFIHAFLDGRDTPPQSALASLKKLQACCDALRVPKIASLIGRYYAMDRDNRWERTQVAYDLLTQGKAQHQASTAIEGLELAYAAGETDEFVKPTSIHDVEQGAATVQNGDSVIFMNFRADRARQLTRAFVEQDFKGFTRSLRPTVSNFVTLTEYATDLNVTVAFAPTRLKNVFGAYISDVGLTQLRIAETEKYAHVTFFFNGGHEQPFKGEDRILVPSPNVATYDLQPEMSAYELTDQLMTAINSKKYDVIICNYANADMVGHSGNMPAAIKAVEVLDDCIGKVITALTAVGGEALITADHGNIEKMADEGTGQAHTAHTTNPVPLIYVGRPATFVNTFGTQHFPLKSAENASLLICGARSEFALAPKGENRDSPPLGSPIAKVERGPLQGTLTDIAPTLLTIMGLAVPVEMTGHALVELTLVELTLVELTLVELTLVELTKS